ncbi:hypothetical protein V8D89_000764 [Ganoderma adspersum]
MATTSTTETRVRGKRAAVPVLLEAFPVPPSFIPPSPLVPNVSTSFPRSPSPLLSSPKPPPSSPPSAPLPPVPGPSRITEHETLMFISAARSRRTSKMSLASCSTYSQRDSIISADGCSPPSLSPSNSTPYDSSRSIRSFSSSSSLSVPLQRHAERSPVIQPRIAEEDAADLTRMSLDEISMHSPLPEHLSDDEKVLDIGISRRLPRYDPRDSISSVDMSEIPLLHDEMDVEAPPPVLPPISIPGRTRSLPRRLRHFAEKALPPLPPPPLTQPPPPPSETPPSAAPSQPLSRSAFQALTHSHTDRADSPDIGEILASTPRPRRKSSHGSGLRSRSTSRSARGLRRTFSDAQSAPGSRRGSALSSGSGDHPPSVPSLPHLPSRGREPWRPACPTELAYAQTAMTHDEPEAWNEDSFVSDYGVPLDETGTPFDVGDGDDEEARLDRELDGDGSDSDSDLDLHTPLPQLMVRDGLLSPNSKLVASSRGTTPLPNDRPGSGFSVASAAGSIMTKNGLFKDERDTVKRRVRHRDGKLLRGGIGLTTGLGWSDSEDEDAPSPLVRQMSTGSLQKQRASAMSSRSLNSISRSYSGGHVSRSGTDEFGVLPKALPSSAPPTAWLRPRLGSSLNRRTSTSSSLSSGSSTSAMSRTMSRGSTSSLRSAPPCTPSRRNLDAKLLGYICEGAEMGFTTPSTSSSTASLVTPITPAESPSQSRPRRGSASSKAVPVQLDSLDISDLTPRRDVVRLNTPSKSSPSTPALTSRKASVPRPLRLPQVQGSLRTPSSSTSTPSAWAPVSASVGPSSAPSLRQVPSQGLRQPQATTVRSTSTASSAPPLAGVGFPSLSPSKPSPVGPSSPPSSMSRLRPRTGTGMVYRTTPSAPATPVTPAPRPSMMRMPSTKSLRSVKSVGIAI